MSTCVDSTRPLIFPDIYSHSWAQGWPAPPVQDAEDKCQFHPVEASYACMQIGKQIDLAYHTLRLECPSFRRALMALCLPTSYRPLMELENGTRVWCLLVEERKTKTHEPNGFTSSTFSVVLCLPMCSASALPIVKTLSWCMSCKGCSTPAK